MKSRILFFLYFLGIIVLSSSCLNPLYRKEILEYNKILDMKDEKISKLTSPVAPLPPSTPENELKFEMLLNTIPSETGFTKFSPNGKYLLIGLNGPGASLWSFEKGKRLKVLKCNTHIQGGAFSSDNNYFAILSNINNTVSLWETASGKKIRTLGIERYARYKSINFTPDNKYIRLNGAKKGLVVNRDLLWRVSDGKKIDFNQNKTFFSPNARLALLVNVKREKLVYVENKSTIFEIKDVYNDYKNHGFTPDNRYIIHCDETSRIMKNDKAGLFFIDTQTGDVSKKIYINNNICMIDISFDSQYMFSVHYDETKLTYNLWNLFTGKLIKQLESGLDIRNPEVNTGNFEFYKLFSSSNTIFQFSPDGKHFVYIIQKPNTSMTVVNYCDITTGNKIFSFTTDRVSFFDFHPNGKYLVLSGKKYTVYNLLTKTVVNKFHGIKHNPFFNQASYSPDGNTIFLADPSSPILWNLKEGKFIKRLESGARLLKFNKQGNMALGVTTNDSVKIWDMKNSNRVVDLIGHQSIINDAVFSSNGKWIATASGHHFSSNGKWFATPRGPRYFLYRNQKVGNDNTARIWNVENGKKIHCFQHSLCVKNVFFSQDNKYLITISHTESIKKYFLMGKMWQTHSIITFWNIETGNKEHTINFENKNIDLATFNPNSNYMLMSFRSLPGQYFGSLKPGHYFELWDLSTKKKVKEYMWDLPSISINSIITSMKFSPNGKYVAAANTDSSCFIWNLKEDHIYKSFQESEPIYSVDFSPDNKNILTYSNGAARIRNIHTDKLFLSFIPVVEKEWVIQTENGFFDLTEKAKDYIYFAKGFNTYEADQFFEDFYRPNLFGIVMSGKTIELPKINIVEKIDQFPPPTVKIISPKAGDTMNQKQVELTIEATDNGGGIYEVKLLHNGKRIVGGNRAISVITEEEKKGVTIQSFKINLVNGKNVFIASAFSKGRIESSEYEIEIYFKGQLTEAKLYMIVVGIDQYKNKRLNLNYARKDAEGFLNTLQSKSKNLFTQVELHALYDQKATKTNILEKLDIISENIEPDDVFIFYYAGHGSMVGNNYYFVTSECVRLYEEKRVKEEALCSTILQEKFAKIKALKQLVIIDACQAGGATKILALRGAAEEKALAQLSRSSGIHVLASAGSEQFAAEFKEIGHGIFTYALLKAINGSADGSPKDGKVTIYELKSYLDDQVPSLTEKYKGEAQYPYTFSRGHDFPLTLNE